MIVLNDFVYNTVEGFEVDGNGVWKITIDGLIFYDEMECVVQWLNI